MSTEAVRIRTGRRVTDQIHSLVVYDDAISHVLAAPAFVRAISSAIECGRISVCVATPEASTDPADLDRVREFGATPFLLNEEAVRNPERLSWTIHVEDMADVHAVHVLILHAGALDAAVHHEGGPRLMCVRDRHINGFNLDALLETGWPDRLPIEGWSIVEDRTSSRTPGYWESVLGLTNGYIGCRATHEEIGSSRRTYGATFLNGVFSRRPYTYPVRFPGYATHYEGVVNLLDWRIFDVVIDGNRIDGRDEEFTSNYSRRLDMQSGSVRRSLARDSGHTRVELTSEWFVSSVRPNIAAERYEILLRQAPTAVHVEAALNLGPVSKAFGEKRVRILREGVEPVPEGIGAGRWFLLAIDDSHQRVCVCIHTRFHGARSPSSTQTDTLYIDSAEVVVDKSLTGNAWVDRIVSLHDGVAGEDDALIERGLAAIRQAAEIGFDALFSEHKTHWKDVWDMIDVSIDGPMADQQAVRYALFQLYSHAPTRDDHSVSATGLVGDGYGGHVFWDTEIYVLPFLDATYPDLAKHALRYRHLLLEKARKRARELDSTGAMYAWNSIDGEECGVVFEASTAQFHLNCAIAYAFWAHYHATNDLEFLLTVATPVIWETAIYLSHLGEFIESRDGAFCLNVVCGPDEYACGVDNNAYFNYMTRWYFERVFELLDLWQASDPRECAQVRTRAGLTDTELTRMRAALERMYLPQPNGDGIIPQDDSYLHRNPAHMNRVAHHTDIRDLMHPLKLWRMQVTKQADVVLLFYLHPELFNVDTVARNLEFYEARTNHGSSLSPSVHSIVSNAVGRTRNAYNYFRVASRLDLDDFKRNAWKGLHLACLGGTWLSVVHGFAGVRFHRDHVSINPNLPDEWKCIVFKVRFRESVMGIRIDSTSTLVTLQTGDGCEVAVGGHMRRIYPSCPSLLGSNGQVEITDESNR